MSAIGPSFEILVVEDDFLICADLSSHMRDAGHTITEAASGDAAIAHLGSGSKFEVIVTDITLGDGLNGWDVADNARRFLPRIAVIYVSGNPRDPNRAVEGSRFFDKPYDNRVIEQACTELCRGKQMR